MISLPPAAVIWSSASTWISNLIKSVTLLSSKDVIWISVILFKFIRMLLKGIHCQNNIPLISMKHSSPPPACPSLLPKKVLFNFNFCLSFFWTNIVVSVNSFHEMPLIFPVQWTILLLVFYIPQEGILWNLNTLYLKLFLLLQLTWVMSKNTFPPSNTTYI